MIGHPLQTSLAEIRRSWLLFLGLGVLLIVLGAIALGATWLTTLLSVLMLGWLLLIGGVMEIISALWSRRSGSVFLNLLDGLLDLVVGLLLVRHPATGALALTLLIAVFLLVGGTFRAVVAAVIQPPNWFWAVLAGAVAALLGCLIWAEWPEAAQWVIGTFVGIELLMRGWWWVMFSLAARQLPAPSNETPTTT